MREISKWLFVIFVLIPLISGCNKSNVKTNESSSLETQTESTSKPQASETTELKAVLWDDAKADNLGILMHQWGTSMGQVYKEYDLKTNVDYNGLLLPKDLVTGDIKPVMSDKKFELAWEKDGQITSEYTIVAFYSDFETKDIRATPHSYLFVIHNEQPKVLIKSQTQDTEDNTLHFNETENPDLLAGFEQIFNGTYVAKSDDEVSASKPSSLDEESLRYLDLLEGTYYTELEENGGASFSIDKTYYTDLKKDRKYKITGITQDDTGSHSVFYISWDIDDYETRYGYVGPGPQAFSYELHVGIQGNSFALLMHGTENAFTQTPGYLE